jgi:HD-like signal output (HDOD) protein
MVERGFPPVENLPEAVQRLGTVTVLQIAFETQFCPFCSGAPAYGLTKLDVWFHSTATWQITREVLRQMPSLRIPQVAALAASIHDLGKLVLPPPEMTDTSALRAAGGTRRITLPEAERSVFGLDHAVVGALIARRWRLGEDIAQAILHHHAPATDARPLMTDLLVFADRVAEELAPQVALAELDPAHDPGSTQRLGLTEADVARIRAVMKERMEWMTQTIWPQVKGTAAVDRAPGGNPERRQAA